MGLHYSLYILTHSDKCHLIRYLLSAANVLGTHMGNEKDMRLNDCLPDCINSNTFDRMKQKTIQTFINKEENFILYKIEEQLQTD